MIAFASAHFVLAALAEPLRRAGSVVPGDAVEFLDQIEAANIERNAGLREFAIRTAARFNEIGVEPVALKGAAFLFSRMADQSNAPWRFMQDVDLLVPEARLAACVEVLRAQGFVASKATYDPHEEAHYPPLVSPCQTFSVELHTRLFGLNDYELPSSEIVSEARPAAGTDARLLVPSARHRLMHILAHAQLHNRNYVRRRLVLKDLLDISMLDRESALSPAQSAGSDFSAQRAREATSALLAAWQIALHSQSNGPDGSAAGCWAHHAIERLSWPQWRKRLSMPADHLRLEIARLRTEPGHLTRRVRTLASRDRLRHTASNWLSKQRQYHWH